MTNNTNVYDNYTVSTSDVLSSGPVTADITLAAPRPQDIADRYYGTVDYFKRQTEPAKRDLIKQFKRVVFSCANINSDSVACKKLRLYVKTSATQRKPRVPTKPVKTAQLNFLLQNYGQHNFFKEFATVEEVIEHPILRLFKFVNESNFSDEYSLFKDTQLYLEIVGTAYWFLDTTGSIFGTPNQIWLLPSHFVEPKRNPGSTNFVDYYEYNSGTGVPIEKFKPEEILVFKFTHLENPYVAGFSPTRAAWEDIAI